MILSHSENWMAAATATQSPIPACLPLLRARDLWLTRHNESFGEPMGRLAHHEGRPTRRRPACRLSLAWERYRERATTVVAAVKDDDRQRLRDLFGEHAEALKDLRGRIV